MSTSNDKRPLHMHIMKRSTIGLIIGILVAGMSCQRSNDSLSHSAATSLNGAWELISSQYIARDGSITEGTPNESFFIFTDDYYSMGYSYHRVPSPMFEDPWSPTEAERMARYSALAVNAGSYELIDSLMVLRPRFALYPSVMNSRTEIIYELAADSLTMIYYMQTSADGVQHPYYQEGNKLVLHLRRVR